MATIYIHPTQASADQIRAIQRHTGMIAVLPQRGAAYLTRKAVWPTRKPATPVEDQLSPWMGPGAA